ncbi:prepilin-type N-terminal cleavage/methylation domain-containing protein [Desulfosporosinus sp. Sb-LF]|uniref:type II secretion system protein n=1 Tax=Desulfosporosinus sp. Sb-LF TaxID=2560027 RepID=UPI00107FBF67|nr:prepilin-type N-terminal cleavage/methylation domain-containing protein [Desulfosporosinus sp. Sb-LF]TGE34212.1 prepilin-type N-terminal cleavage/methylation domain-containing protein [Desulfosporosinus sp. Sb-LF]
MNNNKRDNGFTLIEVLAVVIIIGVLATIVIPKLGSSTLNARQKADIATAHQVKAALDRYQVENGNYPKKADVVVNAAGEVVNSNLIPKYINKLDKTTTQQIVNDANKGFGILTLTPNSDKTQFSITEPGADVTKNTIMIYLDAEGLAAEVRVYNDKLDSVLWTSAN